MSIDLTTIFVAVSALSGAILLADIVFWKPRRRVAAGTQIDEPIFVTQARSLFPVLLIVLLVRSFVFEPFRIPSASMMPGLEDGDFIIVSKFSYGLRLPVLNTRILRTGAPRRGDVIVFRLPTDPNVHYIKRLVGLPGDHIVVHDNRLTINGQLVPMKVAGSFAGGFGFTGSPLALERFGVAPHVVMFAPDQYARDYDGVVPAGRYFFMGDNRNDSQDSRFSAVGFVPEQNLVGRATMIWMNWRLPGWPDWHRVGSKIR
jgi:signal peptidase I